jgi:hypothetical protein
MRVRRLQVKILYVGRFGQTRSNQDEEAVAHALTQLGHDVMCADEGKVPTAGVPGTQLILFNKWTGLRKFKRGAGCPAVFWYWDLVWHPDPTLRGRCETRMSWFRDVLPHADLGFCTDGDWVNEDATGKLLWLPQGADGRVVGRGTRRDRAKPLLFTGEVKNSGQGRQAWYNKLVDRFGPQLTHYRNGVHGREMADAIASHHITLAPAQPVTDSYWSNRIWNALGFGAFLLHPYCARLADMYQDGHDLVFYHDVEDMFAMIDKYIHEVDDRHSVAENGLNRTLAEHTYRHRCMELLATIKNRFGVS